VLMSPLTRAEAWISIDRVIAALAVGSQRAFLRWQLPDALLAGTVLREHPAIPG
jgi:hypothetical protein